MARTSADAPHGFPRSPASDRDRDDDAVPAEQASAGRRTEGPVGAALRRARALGSALVRSNALTYGGVGLIVAGFAVLAFTWGRVAGTVAVPLQLPYIASGGFTGLALVMLGVAGIHLDAKRRDAQLRDRRLEELASTLDALARALDDGGADEER